MPTFLTPLHESNDCHEPAGSPAGGQFCSGEGGTPPLKRYEGVITPRGRGHVVGFKRSRPGGAWDRVTVHHYEPGSDRLQTFRVDEVRPEAPEKAIPCEPGAKGQCFANANRWNTQHGEEGDTVVHGKVTNVEGQRFPHAWVERAETVIDPTAGVVMPKQKFYDLMSAEPEARYSSRDAIRTQMRAGHHGPWTPAEQAAAQAPRETIRQKRQRRAAGVSRMKIASGGEAGRLERERLDRLARGRATQQMIRAIRKRDA
jgi:hypothetical protein